MTTKKFDITNRYCYSCEVDLTAENTAEHGGYDGSSHHSAWSAGFKDGAEPFIKCDDCFNADIDRYLDNLYN
jgi:hypothetical protein